MPAPPGARRNLALLIAAQVMLQNASIVLIASSALVAFELAHDKSLATLPLALGMITSALLMTPASRFMQRRGRRAGFMLGALAGLASALLALAAWHWRSFPLFLAASVFFGAYQGCAQFYRFAAVEASAPGQQARAISWVVAAGLISALTGPALAQLGGAAGEGYGRVFAVLVALAVVALLLLSGLRLPPMAPLPPDGGRPLAAIVRQPVFLAAAAASLAGYGVMASTMSATPLAMQLCGYSVFNSASVIQWHILGMFVPSLFVGHLIARLGALPVMVAGLAAFGVTIAIALSGTSLAAFYGALTLLGVGWNFLYVGGSTLLTQAWQPGEQARVQASHDLLVFAIASLGTLSSGRVLASAGWNSVNTFTLPLPLLAAGMLFYYWRSQKAVHGLH